MGATVAPIAELRIVGDEVVVHGEATLTSRPVRLFFRSVLGATADADGWRCPRRRTSLASLVIRINGYLEQRGFEVVRHGIADREVQRDIERHRSFKRTRESAAAFKDGRPTIDLLDARQRLSDFGWDPDRVLRPHQEAALAHALAAANTANFSVPGSGKTAVALATAAAHLSAGTIDLVVVVGPLASFAPWEREVALSLGAHLPTKRVRGDAQERRSVYSAPGECRLLLVSLGTAAADRVALIELCKTRDVMLIVDESHRIKRFRGGLWAPAIVQIASHARVRMILSGTPMPQSGRDLYSQLKVLWPAGELTGSRDAFGARLDADFVGVLRDVQPFISRTPKEALGLPPYKVVRHEVEMASLQSEIYELIRGGLRQRLAEAETWTDKIEALRRARPLRLLQAAANPDLLNSRDGYFRVPPLETPSTTLMDRLAGYGRHEVPAKSEFALSLLEEVAAVGGKAVCWSNFITNLDQFSALVRLRLGIECFQIDGRVPTGDEASDDHLDARPPNPDDVDTRERIIQRFLAEVGPAVLVANPASCSESISLHTSCHNAIYLDRTYDCAQFLQSIDRIHRLGLAEDATVRIHILMATNGGGPTIDHLVDASLLGKESAMRQLLEGAALRPIAQSEDPADDANGDSGDLDALLRYLLGEDD